jgi:hypothetical protein
LTVVGITSNIVQNDRTRQTIEPIVYVPYAQQAQPNMFAFARSHVPPATLVAPVRRAVYAMDPQLPVPALWPLERRLDRKYARERTMTMLFGGLALSAGVNHLLKSQLADVSPTDPLALIIASLVLLVTTGLGSSLPLRRAVRVGYQDRRPACGAVSGFVVGGVALLAQPLLPAKNRPNRLHVQSEPAAVT